MSKFLQFFLDFFNKMSSKSDSVFIDRVIFFQAKLKSFLAKRFLSLPSFTYLNIQQITFKLSFVYSKDVKINCWFKNSRQKAFILWMTIGRPTPIKPLIYDMYKHRIDVKLNAAPSEPSWTPFKLKWAYFAIKYRLQKNIRDKFLQGKSSMTVLKIFHYSSLSRYVKTQFEAL